MVKLREEIVYISALFSVSRSEGIQRVELTLRLKGATSPVCMLVRGAEPTAGNPAKSHEPSSCLFAHCIPTEKQGVKIEGNTSRAPYRNQQNKSVPVIYVLCR